MKCDACPEEFEVESEPGALIWSPPGFYELPSDACKKRHICQRCYKRIVHIFFNEENYGEVSEKG
jgi:hypothetical protein